MPAQDDIDAVIGKSWSLWRTSSEIRKYLDDLQAVLLCVLYLHSVLTLPRVLAY